VKVLLFNFGDCDFKVEAGMRVAQVCGTYMSCDVMWRIHECDMTHEYMGHDSKWRLACALLKCVA